MTTSGKISKKKTRSSWAFDIIVHFRFGSLLNSDRRTAWNDQIGRYLNGINLYRQLNACTAFTLSISYWTAEIDCKMIKVARSCMFRWYSRREHCSYSWSAGLLIIIELKSQVANGSCIIIFQACIDGLLCQVERLLKTNPGQCNDLDKDGLTPLHHAARGNYLQIIDCLLNAGAGKTCRNMRWLFCHSFLELVLTSSTSLTGFYPLLIGVFCPYKERIRFWR